MKKQFTKKKVICIIMLLLLAVIGSYVLLNLNRARTILSLTRIDDYPLYSMRYYGDYQLNYTVDYPGVNMGDASLTFNDFEMMCSSFLAWNEEGEPLFCRNLDYAFLRHPVTVLFTDAPGKNASISMVNLFYLGYSDINAPSNSLFKDQALLSAPRLTMDGVNEYGVSSAILSVPSARTPYDPGKPTTDEAGISRLILDNARTLDEAIEELNQYNIAFHGGPEHFMIADANGDSAVIEFIDGETIILRNEKPWQVCTNFIISRDLFEKVGKDRYDLAEETLGDKNGILSEEEAMELLSAISQGGTVWSVVYNLKTGEADIVMGRKYDQVHSFDLKMNNE